MLPIPNVLWTDNNFNSLQFLHAFLLSADCFTKLAFSKNSFKNTITASNSLGPDQETTWVDLDK